MPQLVLDDMPHAGALLHDDVRLAEELVERHLASGERVAGWDGEDDLVEGELLERERAVAAERADDAELELALGDLVDHRLRVEDRERDVD